MIKLVNLLQDRQNKYRNTNLTQINNLYWQIIKLNILEEIFTAK